MANTEFAPGIKDKSNLGQVGKLQQGKLYDYIVQKHKAQRAGEHFDIRLGNKSLGLISFATKKHVPTIPNEKIKLFQQPVHSYNYKDFQGIISSGYGAGTVTKEHEGDVLITSVKPTHISFSLADTTTPARFSLVKTKEDKEWLLIRHSTPQDTGHVKAKYTTIPKDKVFNRLEDLKEGDVVQPKVDGALALISLDKNVELLSHRLSKRTGKPIVHTERVLRERFPAPKEFDDTLLLGELYGTKDGKTIHPSVLGGILNSSIGKSIRTQDRENVKLKTMVFDIPKFKGKPFEGTYKDKLQAIKKMVKYLPKGKFEVPESVVDSKGAVKLLKSIMAKKHSLTNEGIVIHSEGKVPAKVKLTDEHNVFIRDMFDAEKGSKYEGKAVGGFVYSHTPDGEIVGRVGTGLSDEVRRDMFANKDKYVGRVARVHAAEKAKSGALRIPSFIALDESRGMAKESADELEDQLLPHQQRVVDRISRPDQPGLVLMHGLGSGKTLSSIAAYKKLNMPAEIIAPASLKTNYRKELKKWVGRVPKDVHIHSLQQVARRGIDPERVKNKLLVIDEAHRLRNEDTKGFQNLKKVHPAKRLLLTGTPIYNEPADIAKLVNMAGGSTMLPENKEDFDQKFVDRKEINPTFLQRMSGITPGEELHVKNKEVLQKVFHKMIDYYPGSTEEFPTVHDETVKVPMTDDQQNIYKAIMHKLPWYLRAKVKAGLPPNRQDLNKLVPFLSGARMISNSTKGFSQVDEAPKFDTAVAYLKQRIATDPNFKSVIYSNFLDNGVNEYKRRLDKDQIPYGEFTGQVEDADRDKMVSQYNENKLKALLLSSAGGEGLDLKGTRLVQIMEPHFNLEKIKQVVGRAARYKSHEGLPKDQQDVLVQHYLSTMRQSSYDKFMGNKSTSADEYLQNMSDDKDRLNQEFVNLIRN